MFNVMSDVMSFVNVMLFQKLDVMLEVMSGVQCLCKLEKISNSINFPEGKTTGF
jgi:hypothetical protein